MRFGIEFGSYPMALDPVEVCREVSRRAQVAYKNNFEALFVAQHYATGPDSAILQSLPLLSYLAGQVPGMYLGTSIFLLPFTLRLWSLSIPRHSTICRAANSVR